MFEIMRPYVIGINLVTLVWFVTIQFFRFSGPGRTCSGDYLNFAEPKTLPKQWKQLYLYQEGGFLLYYIVAHYIAFVLQKIMCVCITNKAEVEFEKKKSLIENKV